MHYLYVYISFSTDGGMVVVISVNFVATYIKYFYNYIVIDFVLLP